MAEKLKGKGSVDDMWANFLSDSEQTHYAADHPLTGFAPFLVVACIGGSIADGLIREVRKKWQQPWAVVVVLFVVGWVLTRFVPREGVRILVAGMYGRIGPASWDAVVKPLYAKLGGDAKKLPTPGKPGKADKADKPGHGANCLDGANSLLLDDGTANDGAWQPPDMEHDIRPLAQAMSGNRQMLYDVSGEIFQEMQRRQMVDPDAANETAEDFQKALQDVFSRLAA